MPTKSLNRLVDCRLLICGNNISIIRWKWYSIITEDQTGNTVIHQIRNILNRNVGVLQIFKFNSHKILLFILLSLLYNYFYSNYQARIPGYSQDFNFFFRGRGSKLTIYHHQLPIIVPIIWFFSEKLKFREVRTPWTPWLRAWYL